VKETKRPLELVRLLPKGRKKVEMADTVPWQSYEARSGESYSSHQHGDGRIDLDVSPGFFGHDVSVLMLMAQRYVMCFNLKKT
jgi:hypothetical protein